MIRAALLSPRGRLALVSGAALAIRVVYGLFVHPPFSFLRSDASGYISRAQDLLDGKWSPDPQATFFPYGTHYLLAAALGLSGRAEWSVGVSWALLATGAVAFTFLAAERLLAGSPRAALTVGLALAVYPPWIEHAGFALSETPTAFCVAVATWSAMRLSQEGRRRDALYLGAALAVGVALRPQIVLSAMALAVVLIWRGRRLPGITWRAGALAALPLVLVLGFSAGRMRYHTGHLGLVSTNGAFNYALGRCHAHTLSATRTPRSAFQPPGFLRLWRFREKSGVDPFPPLDPAFGPELTFDGQLWDEEPARGLAKRCVAETGPLRQARYSLSHIVLLWAYNVPWPSTGPVAMVSSFAHALLLLPGLLVALVRSLRKEHALALTASVHVFALLAVAMAFFGEARLRLPYDGIIVMLAVWVYADWLARLRARRAGPLVASQPG